MSIVKTFNGKQESDLSAGVRIFIDWEQLAPALEKAVMLRPDEQISGYIIDDKGINVSIGRKPGRKVANRENDTE